MEKAVCECRRSFSVPAGFQGDAVPPGYVSGFSGTGNDTPLSSAQRTRPRRRKVNCPEGAREGALGYGAGRGKKVRYTPRLSWGILRGALRCACPSSLPKARSGGNSVPCNAWNAKRHANGVPFLSGRFRFFSEHFLADQCQVGIIGGFLCGDIAGKELIHGDKSAKGFLPE